MSNKQKASIAAFTLLVFVSILSHASEFHLGSPTGPEVTKGEAIRAQAVDKTKKVFKIDEVILSEKGTLVNKGR